MDPEIQRIKTKLENSEHPFFELVSSVYRKLNKKNLFYVPPDMIYTVLHTYHNQMGHVGVDKTYELVVGHSYILVS